MSIFIVDPTRPGSSVALKEHKMGQRASQVGALNFQDVKLGADALLGQENRGFHMMMIGPGQGPRRHRRAGRGHRAGRA